MNNLVYLNKDPILEEFNSYVDKSSAKKMIAFKYFNGNLQLFDQYLKDNCYENVDTSHSFDFTEPKSQLEFSF